MTILEGYGLSESSPVVLYGHPATAEAAVIGMHDPALGEEIKAVAECSPY